MAIIGSFVVPHPPLIVPEVGRGREKDIIKTINAYNEVADEIRDLKPDTIIISSPHAPMFSDYFCLLSEEKLVGDLSQFGADSIKFDKNNDLELVRLIEEISLGRNFPCGRLDFASKELDHGSIVPLYFINQKYANFKLIVIGLSGLSLVDHYRAGMIIRDACDRLDRRAVWVASGDLSHKLQDYGPYGFSEDGVLYDKQIIEILGNGEFGKLLEFDYNFLDKASECGHRSFTMMAGSLDGKDVLSKKLSHEDITGVGYGICSFIPDIDNDARHFLYKYLNNLEDEIKKEIDKSDIYVKIARQAINEFVLNKTVIEADPKLPFELLNDRAGVFVSIHKFGMLRGCIGTTSPITDNIASEIINNAVSAASNDSRFNPITQDELSWLNISVDVLGEAEDISSSDMLDVKKYGVIVTSGYKRGLLLPDLDGVDTVEEQIEIAKRKAGISDDEEIKLQRFEVIRHY